jgi:hypothetical protein
VRVGLNLNASTIMKMGRLTALVEELVERAAARQIRRILPWA